MSLLRSRSRSRTASRRSAASRNGKGGGKSSKGGNQGKAAPPRRRSFSRDDERRHYRGPDRDGDRDDERRHHRGTDRRRDDDHQQDDREDWHDDHDHDWQALEAPPSPKAPPSKAAAIRRVVPVLPRGSAGKGSSSSVSGSIPQGGIPSSLDWSSVANALQGLSLAPGHGIVMTRVDQSSILIQSVMLPHPPVTPRPQPAAAQQPPQPTTTPCHYYGDGACKWSPGDPVTPWRGTSSGSKWKDLCDTCLALHEWQSETSRSGRQEERVEVQQQQAAAPAVQEWQFGPVVVARARAWPL